MLTKLPKTILFLFLGFSIAAAANAFPPPRSRAMSERDMNAWLTVTDYKLITDSSYRQRLAASPVREFQAPAGNLQQWVERLCSADCQGRKSGTTGATEAARIIAASFSRSGMRQLFPNSWYQGLDLRDGSRGHNVIGILNGAYVPTINEKYIIIAAHYDGLGTIEGRLYPGADSNASGVASMLEIASKIHELRAAGATYKGLNFIFVALDAKTPSYEGAEALLSAIENGIIRDPRDRHIIRSSSIKAFVNLDMLGSTESPIHDDREDFLIMLSSDKENETPTVWKMTLAQLNETTGANLDLGYDYYGSKDFTNLFYRRVGDQRVFLDAGYKCVVFTSGITMNTNKTSDSPATLDYDILERRCRLIGEWILQGCL